ncbi:MAG TPA: transketolase [Gemmatimonadaceae bacterium]|nr:transketolase [Gemmatimonadaceae bacterium]
MSTPDLDLLCINTIRTLAMDAVQAANSGHPGTPMALAPLGYKLFTEHMAHDPAAPDWPNRDRFVLSCGHASMLLYACLYLTGYGLELDDLKQFRQWGSKTPGHPEHGHTRGVETTTGPLGQGLTNAVGMALAESHLAAKFNRPGHEIVDHHTFFICSDGDLMEGISHEAASFAGHFQLGKLIGFYDDNRITIDGHTELTFTDDTARRFEAYGWQVLHIGDVNHLSQIDAAVAQARADTQRPSLIITRTHIGFGSPNKQDTNKAHGEPLGVEEIKLTKQNLGWLSDQPFFVPEPALKRCRQALPRGKELREAWEARFAAYTRAFPADAAEFTRRLAGELPKGWEQKLPVFTRENGTMATRAASQAVLNALAPIVPELFGGSADLTPSNGTSIKSEKNYEATDRSARYIHSGIREHAMAAIMNGMALHRGVIPFGGTFLIFSDYMRPAVRLAALMRQHVLFIYTHDSIGLGEDGPTHQPIEQLSSLRAIPHLTVLRPADATESVEAWRVALTRTDGPVALVFTRQKLPFIERPPNASASATARGGYVLADAEGGKPRVVLMSAGSEVQFVLEARATLQKQGIPARVVSMPSHELFAAQDAGYRDQVLPPGIPRVAIEAAQPMSWHRWLLGAPGTAIGLDHFGASAPYERIYQEFGITADAVVKAAKALLG